MIGLVLKYGMVGLLFWFFARNWIPVSKAVRLYVLEPLYADALHRFTPGLVFQWHIFTSCFRKSTKQGASVPLNREEEKAGIEFEDSQGIFNNSSASCLDGS